MDKKAVVFDFGGVLVDWNPRYLFAEFFPDNFGAMEEFFKEINFQEMTTEFDRGLPFAEGIAKWTTLFPAYKNIFLAYDNRWEETVAGPIQPTVDILTELKKAGYPLYGLSNWSAEKFRLIRNKYQFFNWFGTIILSGEVRLVKPDPAIYQFLLKAIGYQADQCLFIDDSLSNIHAARELGFDTIHFRSPDQLKADLFEKGLKF